MSEVCAHLKTVPIVYGMPGTNLMARAERGEVALGGCMVGPPGRRCVACGLEVYEQEVDDDDAVW